MNDFFFIFSLSQPFSTNFGLKRRHNGVCFFNFLKFFAIFLEFSITGRVRTHRSDFFIFSLSRQSPTYFGSKRTHNSVFQFFEVFTIFLEFSITDRVGTCRNDFYLFSLFLGLPQHILAWKEAIIVFSNFLNFFTIFFLIFYYRSGRNSLERFFFIFSLSQPFPTYFGLNRCHSGVF